MVSSRCYGAAVSTVAARITVRSDDEIEAAAATVRLRDALRELDRAVSIEQLAGAPPPDGARSGPVVELGTLLAIVSAHPEIVTTVLTHIGDWVTRRGRGQVEVVVGEQRLVIERATPAEQRKIVDAFVERVFAVDR